jgi:hypothetical protein
MSPFFTSEPRVKCAQKLFSVKDVQDEIKQFNALYEVDEKKSSSNTCGDSARALNWRKYVREAVINCAGTPVELDFFEKIGGGKTELIPAKEMSFKQNCDFDYNIVAKTSQEGAGPGAPFWITLHRSVHSVNGKTSYPIKGWELFIYEDMQYLRILDKNTDVDYAHKLYVAPKNKRYTGNVRAGKKIMVSPATQVGGYTCNTDETGVHITPGFFYNMTMLRLRVQWKQAVDLMKGYRDVLQFGIMFDNDGNEINCWEYYKKIKAREQLKLAFNLQMFTGQKADNVDVLNEMSDNSYPGFDGYVTQVMNGGGNVIPYDVQYGIDPETDFGAMMLKQDSMKRNSEWTMLSALNFDMAFDKNFNKMLKDSNVSCSFETFKRTGSNMEDIKRLNIRSVMLWNMTVHRKAFSALNDTRLIGNGDFPWWAFFMPTVGPKDQYGRSVPPLEFFTNQGCALTGQHEEHQYDAREEKNGCEEIGGWMSKTIGMVAHCLRDHIIFKPRRKC